MIRINKYLSVCGVTSRRGAERLIKSGQITINNKIVEELGTMVDETLDIVKVNGTTVVPIEKKEYLLLNKPSSVMTTLHDPFKRKTVAHYLKQLKTRVYPVGRLDYDTRGVLLMTNDGDLAYRLTHPKYRVKKIYEAKVKGKFDQTAADNIAKGIKLEDGAIGKAEVDILQVGPNWARIRLILTEGRKREVKQLCKNVGHPVLKLVRVEFAGLNVKGLRNGEWRLLENHEIEKLKYMVGL